MPSTISPPLEEQVRQYLTDTSTPSNMVGYDPTTTDSTSSSFLPITTNWGKFGDTYPIVLITGNDSQIIGGGDTGYTGIQGDGSGVNQYQVYNYQLQVHAETQESYRNSLDAYGVTDSIYQELHSTIQNNASSALSDAMWVGCSPSGLQEESDGSTVFRVSRVGSISVGVQNTP